MPTDVIYARVPSEVKLAAEDYAAAKGFTLTAAVSQLLGLGIEAVQNDRSIQTLQTRVASLEREVENVTAASRHESLRREALEQQVQMLHGAAAVWNDRAGQQVGNCPHAECDTPITGSDLLVSGSCPTCKKAVSSMLVSEAKSNSVDWNQLLPILIAGGLVLGVVAATRGKA
jgi:hypothetical protein